MRLSLDESLEEELLQVRVGGGDEVASSDGVGMRDRLETIFYVSTLKNEVGVQKMARLELP